MAVRLCGQGRGADRDLVTERIFVPETARAQLHHDQRQLMPQNRRPFLTEILRPQVHSAHQRLLDPAAQIEEARPLPIVVVDLDAERQHDVGHGGIEGVLVPSRGRSKAIVVFVEQLQQVGQFESDQVFQGRLDLLRGCAGGRPLLLQELPPFSSRLNWRSSPRCSSVALTPRQ